MNRTLLHKFCCSFFSCLLLSTATFSQTIYYVSTTGNDAADGLSWQTAFRTVQQGLHIAGPVPRQIWVAKGTYYPDEGPGLTDNQRSEHFEISNGETLYGGFAGMETQLAQRNVQINETMLSGDIDQNDGPGFANNDGNSYHVVTEANGEDATAVLDGFTVTSGNANGTEDQSTGAGIYIDHASPTLVNCTFRANSAARGGGIYTDNASSPKVSNCGFTGNKAGNYGGGVTNSGNSSPAFNNCTFSGNNSDSHGGGFANLSGSVSLINCDFRQNSGGSTGGGMLNFGSATLTNCAFWNNTANYGGGLQISSIATATLVSCSFSGNIANNNGGGINNDAPSINVTNSIVWGNTPDEIRITMPGSVATINTSIVQGGCPNRATCNGVQNVNPLFVNAATGDLHLQACSPALDAGNDAANSITTDLDGNPRKVDAITGGIVIDMGPYEYQQVLPTYYQDNDNDGYGNPAVSKQACTKPDGFVTDNTDFNDNGPNVHLPTLGCPSDVTVNNDPGKCSAWVNYTAPTVLQSSYTRRISDTFNYSGQIVEWAVPQGVTQLTITAKGAQGGTVFATAGLGASIKGDLSVSSGTMLNILVGKQPAPSSGGGGGSFVTDAANAPLIIAGGGGGGGVNGINDEQKDGQTGTAGGSGGSGGAGGVNGKGGAAADDFGAGGGGLLTDGGTVGDRFERGGKAFVNGGGGGSGYGPNPGGFGGGGEGFLGGGGGGGYSGGGGGGYNGFSNDFFTGGGGGSYNGGTNQDNQGGANSGDGLVVIAYEQPLDLKVVQTAGLPAGSTFPVGVTLNTFALVENNTDTVSRCSFTVTVKDVEKPVLTCVKDQNFCYEPACRYTVPSIKAIDNCSIKTITYKITGKTNRSGSGNNASGSFNPGQSIITWTVTDKNGNVNSCMTKVFVNNPVLVLIPDAKVNCKGVNENTVYLGYAPASSVTLTAQASGGTAPYKYQWSTGATTPSIKVYPSKSTIYAVLVTDSKGCKAIWLKSIKVVDVRCGSKNEKIMVCHKGKVNCLSSKDVQDCLNHGDQLGSCSKAHRSSASEGSGKVAAVEEKATARDGSVYPNPTTGSFTLQLSNPTAEAAQVLVVDGKGAALERRSVALVRGIQTLSFNLKGRSNGLYLVQVRSQNNVQTFKVFLQQ